MQSLQQSPIFSPLCITKYFLLISSSGMTGHILLIALADWVVAGAVDGEAFSAAGTASLTVAFSSANTPAPARPRVRHMATVMESMDLNFISSLLCLGFKTATSRKNGKPRR